ncbi:MAG: 1-acyl-sn-glycerol-3-phosphate acyltransferase [Rhabdochlamydiaceae bacterium]
MNTESLYIKLNDILPYRAGQILKEFIKDYLTILASRQLDQQFYISLMLKFIDLVKEQINKPFIFEPFHKQIRNPFDYYQFSLDLFRPVLDFENSSVLGVDHILEAKSLLQKGQNVILLANHQTEADPQAISYLLEHIAPDLARDMIFVAGERVVTDPLAIPHSLGRNLLCIYSKRHIDNPPEERFNKQMHNKQTMETMVSLLSKGGCCIYVAPSGGRDRPDAKGEIEVAPFDPQSIEMFYLMAKKAVTPTHFFPLSLKTFDFIPPPKTVEKEIGEKRGVKYTPIHLNWGSKIDMDHFEGCQEEDKRIRRENRSLFIYSQVKKNYDLIK